MEIQLAKKTKLRILCFIQPPQFKPVSTNCIFKALGQVLLRHGQSQFLGFILVNSPLIFKVNSPKG